MNRFLIKFKIDGKSQRVIYNHPKVGKVTNRDIRKMIMSSGKLPVDNISMSEIDRGSLSIRKL